MADNIRVENEKESAWVVSKDEVLGKSDWTGSTHWHVLQAASNFDIVFLLEPCELLHHHFWLIVNSKNDLSNSSLGKCLNLMAKNWKVAEVNEWLWDSKGERSESGTESSNKNQSFHEVVVCLF